MTAFAYTAIPLDARAGAFISGQRDARDESALRAALRNEGLIAIDVRPVHIVDALRHQFSADRLRARDAAWFYSTLRLLLENRVPLESSMRTVEELAPRPRLARAAAEIREALRAGTSLAEAIDKHPGLASAQRVALLRAASESGRLDHAVALIDTSISNSQRIRTTVVGRLLYPAILLLAAIGAIWFLAVRVIPSFAETLLTLGGTLPWQTRLTLDLATVLAWLVPVIFVLAILMGAMRHLWLTPRIRERIASVILRTPIVGSLAWNNQGAIVCDIMGTLIEGGADLIASIDQSREVVTSPVIARRLDVVRSKVREGTPIDQALADHAVLPPMASAVVRAGVRSGDLVGSLRRATNLCVERQEAITNRLLTLLEPAVIVLLAGTVGWVVYSLVTGMLAITDVGAL